MGLDGGVGISFGLSNFMLRVKEALKPPSWTAALPAGSNRTKRQNSSLSSFLTRNNLKRYP